MGMDVVVCSLSPDGRVCKAQLAQGASVSVGEPTLVRKELAKLHGVIGAVRTRGAVVVGEATGTAPRVVGCTGRL